MDLREIFHQKPGQNGRGAMLVCPVCGGKFSRTFDGQSKCLTCMERDKGTVPAVKDDWDVEDMPKRHATFTLTKSFTPGEMETLRLGHIPQEMEDRWFCHVEGNKLFAHRSWSGICIFTVEFRPDGDHIVTVNRNPKQYECRSIKKDRDMVNMLLEHWAKPSRDRGGD